MPPPEPASGAPREEPLLDHRILQDLAEFDENGPELLQAMVDVFREDTPDRIRALVEAIEAQDPEGLVQAAHALKGGAGVLGARAFQSCCARLEGQGRQGRLEGALALGLALEPLYQATLQALEGHLRDQGPS